MTAEPLFPLARKLLPNSKLLPFTLILSLSDAHILRTLRTLHTFSTRCLLSQSNSWGITF
jgi:hypothetical protein